MNGNVSTWSDAVIVDNFSAEIRKILAAQGICLDPQYPGRHCAADGRCASSTLRPFVRPHGRRTG